MENASRGLSLLPRKQSKHSFALSSIHGMETTVATKITSVHTCCVPKGLYCPPAPCHSVAVNTHYIHVCANTGSYHQ